MSSQQILALSGGVGGAKLALGLLKALEAEQRPLDQLTLVCNTADDFEYLGFPVSPDLDTVMYTLAGINNTEQGWGLAGESWQFMQALQGLGEQPWFRLGDKDLATHTQRRLLLQQGKSLSAVTQQLSQALGIKVLIAPMSDQSVATQVHTDEGVLCFQEYFVKRQCQPAVTEGFEFQGLEQASLSPAFLKALTTDLQAIIICPSNPFVSVDPIVKLPMVKTLLHRHTAPVVAVSPIISGQAVKGPSAKMMTELNMPVSALAVAEYYAHWIDVFVLDETDSDLKPAIEALGLKVVLAQTLMHSEEDKQQLAQHILDFTAQYGARQ